MSDKKKVQSKEKSKKDRKTDDEVMKIIKDLFVLMHILKE